MAKFPNQDEPLQRETLISTVWYKFFAAVRRDLIRLTGGGPIPLRSYTVATVPAAADYPANLIYVSNEAGGAIPAFSDGTNWRRLTDRAIIS